MIQDLNIDLSMIYVLRTTICLCFTLHLLNYCTGKSKISRANEKRKDRDTAEGTGRSSSVANNNVDEGVEDTKTRSELNYLRQCNQIFDYV
jgi:hypothetical protein